MYHIKIMYHKQVKFNPGVKKFVVLEYLLMWLLLIFQIKEKHIKIPIHIKYH